MARRRGRAKSIEDILSQISAYFHEYEYVDFSEALEIVDANNRVIGYAFDLVIEDTQADYLVATFVEEGEYITSAFTKLYLAFLDQNSHVNLSELAFNLLEENAYYPYINFGFDPFSGAIVLSTSQNASEAFDMKEYWEEFIATVGAGLQYSWEEKIVKKHNLNFGTSTDDAVERKFGFIPG